MENTAGRRRVLVIGASGSGKTSLIRFLSCSKEPVRKTQAMEFFDFAVDTPGEYVQIPRLFFIALSLTGDSRAVWVVQNAADSRPSLPAGFASSFGHKAVGIVTKIDCPSIDVGRAERFLARAGVPGPYFRVSSVTGEGMAALRLLLS